MRFAWSRTPRLVLSVALVLILARVASAQPRPGRPLTRLWWPEQRSVDVRDPNTLPRIRLPDTPPPPTVAHRTRATETLELSLDEAIRIALQNSEVVRVLTGVSAANSGSTVYDISATNTSIDDAQARFDPTLKLNNRWFREETPNGVLPLQGTGVIDGFHADVYQFDLELAKTLATGGSVGLATTVRPDRTGGNPFFFDPFNPLLLNPQSRSSLSLNLTQPLLAGAGVQANLVPVVLARIETERSYFQFKNSVQRLVLSVAQAYWQLVYARTDYWARQRQVENAQEAVRLADARFRVDINNAAELAQARLTLANFQANLVTSEANVIQFEAALRNLLGMPPSDGVVLVPTTPPNQTPYEPEWVSLIELAEQRRPDLIELKLILEADQQRLLLARNQAQPNLDAVAQYRWDGLSGELPDQTFVSSGPGQFTGWTLGINFSVPLGLRQSRAGIRSSELLLARDRANLTQGLHAAVHQLATNVRSIDQAFAQYVAFREARAAAQINLNQQLAQYRANRVIFLNVLQAITDWGNTISAEANALTGFNAELASLEYETGTILETHGVVFYEERYGSLGPLGRWGAYPAYSESLRPTPNDPRYPVSDEPSEQSFDLRPPPTLRELRPALDSPLP